MSEQIKAGEKVIISILPPYLKTADPMPMLRPCDLVTLGESGLVLERRPGDYWVVKFSKGVFLLESRYLELQTDIT